MEEFDPYRLSEFAWEVLQLHLKYGYGNFKLCNSSFFANRLTDETECLTIAEFAEKAYKGGEL